MTGRGKPAESSADPSTATAWRQTTVRERKKTPLPVQAGKGGRNLWAITAGEAGNAAAGDAQVLLRAHKKRFQPRGKCGLEPAVGDELTLLSTGKICWASP